MLTMEEEEAVNWSDLPDDLSFQILGNFACISDYLRFGSVCVSWHSLLTSDDCSKLLPSRRPLLMIPTPTMHDKDLAEDKTKKKKKKKTKTNSCSFYCISDQRVYDQFKIRMPLNRYCCGSSHGWLVTVDEDEMCFSVQLLNPFTRREISVPPLRAFPYDRWDMVGNYTYLRKAVLSVNPVSNPKDYIVMAIHGAMARLAFFKPGGDRAWSPIEYGIIGRGLDMVEDVIYYNGKFHAVNCRGDVMVCDETKGKAIRMVGGPLTEFRGSKLYLVESSGDLLQVHRSVPMDDEGLYSTDGFKVFKLIYPAEEEAEAGEFEWVEVKNLRDCVLFLGSNASMSISASGFPGCKPNCIYYTDDYVEGYYYNDVPDMGPHDIGVYNCENESFEIHYPTDVKTPIWPAPIWVETTMLRTI